MKIYAVEDTTPPRIVWREARETAKLYKVEEHFGLDVPQSIGYKTNIYRSAFLRAAGTGLSPLEAAESWVEHRKRRLETAKQAVELQRAAVNAALKLRSETEDET